MNKNEKVIVRGLTQTELWSLIISWAIANSHN